MTRQKQIDAIKTAYYELQRIGLQDGWFDVADRLYRMNELAERQHRKGAPDGIRHGLTVTVAAKLFTCEHLISGHEDTDKWKVEDILNIRTEVLYAQAYAKRFHAELTEWAKKWAPMFLRDSQGNLPLDYAELMKVAA